jgi:hypothetical protein
MLGNTMSVTVHIASSTRKTDSKAVQTTLEAEKGAPCHRTIGSHREQAFCAVATHSYELLHANTPFSVRAKNMCEARQEMYGHTLTERINL